MSNIKLDFKYECKNSVLSFNNLDNGVNRFTISVENFGEDVNLDNSIAVVAILKPSGKVSSQFGEVEGNKIIVDLEKSATDEVGVYVAKLLLVSGDKRKMTRSFKYEVEQENILSQILDDVVETSEYPLLTDMLSRLSGIEIDEEQRQINESERILNEEARQTSETSRIEAELAREHNDADREKAEATRGSNENARVKAEKSRSANEGARVEAENLRVEAEAGRVEAENLRNDNYSFMTSDEERRRLEENSRIEAESLRVEAETVRQNSFNAKISEVNSKVLEVNSAKNTMVADTKKAIDKMNNDFNSLSASQQQDAEVVLARDGEESLNARLERDLFIEGKSLKQEIIDLGGLKESQDMAYATDKGYLVCKETKNGTIKDLKISGKSLVNKIENSKILFKQGIGAIGVGSSGSPIVNNKRSIFIVDIKGGSELTLIPTGKFEWHSIVEKDANNVTVGTLASWKKSVYKFTPSNDCVKLYIHTRVSENNEDFEGEVSQLYKAFVLLEGDHTQNPPAGYFEGIASVGNEVDEIEVLSMNSKINSDEFVNEYYVSSVNSWRVGSIANLGHKVLERIDGSLTIKIVSENIKGIRIHWFDANKKFISSTNKDGNVSNIEVESPQNARYVAYHCPCDDFEIAKCDMYINTVVPVKKEDRKTILFRDTDETWKPVKELRGFDTVCDTIELHSDGKYYYHVRTIKGVLNGTHTVKSVEQLSNTNKIQIDVQSFKLIANSGRTLNLICDKLPAMQGSDDIPHVRTDGSSPYGNLILWLDKSYGNTQEDINQKLSSSPIAFIGELAEEKVFEVNSLFLEAFEGETMVSVDSGVVNAPIEFKIASYITNLVLLNQQRISMLEDQVMGMFKSVLNGDMRTLAEALYPQDFVFSDDEIMLLDDK